jgi:hypothetical protein
VEIHNRDIFPSKEVIEVYAPVRAVIANPLIDRPFAVHEAAAGKAKSHYHSLGRLGIGCIVVSTIFAVAERFVLADLRVDALFSVISVFMIILSCCGIVIQLYLLATKCKKRWLLNRFAAERLRSIKFQAYPLSQIAMDEADFVAKVDEFHQTEVVRLGMELNAGEAALALFLPKAAVKPTLPPSGPANVTLDSAARDVYRELRIEYQRRFAAGEVGKLQSRQRIGYAAADILYLVGAALAVASLLGNALFGIPEAVANWIEFLAVSSFIVGLSKTILDNASLAESSEARYQNYVEAITECDNDLMTEKASFPEVVRRIERVVLDELSEFSQSASRISYRL